MRPIDKNYLSLQFKIKIYTKNGTEFHNFFNDIMEKAFNDFQKIRPYGSKGDAGNDGYRKDLGIYYQVYAPRTQNVNERKAKEKLQEDFQKLKKGWNKISEIKEYDFVFNDKYGGSVQLLEAAITKLKVDNPNIEFRLFLAKNLEDVFFKLSESDILGLGFNIDQREAILNAYDYLENVKDELDKENASFAQNTLRNIKDIISSLSDEKLCLDYEILECRCLQKLEKIDEAKDKYKNISERYPKDPRAFLYLAEIYLNEENISKNKEFLEKAKKIDSNYWLLKLEWLVRKSHLGEKIDVENIDEKTFPDDSKIKSNFYRLFALFYENSGDPTNADSFIEKSISLNPNRFSNYIVKLSLIEGRLISINESSQRLEKSPEFLDEIEKLESRFFEHGDIGPRNKAILNLKKINALRIQENYIEIEKLSKEIFELLVTCYFDKQIDQIITGVFQFVSLPDEKLNQLLKYLNNSKKAISDNLSKVLILQFNLRDCLFTVGKKYFEKIGNQKYLDFIINLENKNHGKVLDLLKEDTHFAVSFANTLKEFLGLRKKIIENLPDDKNIQKEKLLLLLNFDKEDFDEAFKILKQLDISKLSYIECGPILQIIHKMEAWDFEIIVLQKLLEKEKEDGERFNLKLIMFNAYFNLKNYRKVLDLGEQLLQEDLDKKILDLRNKEALLSNTIIACFERGMIDKNAFKMSKKLLKRFQLEKPSFKFKIRIEATVYLKNEEVEKAFASVVEGVKIKKVLSPNEYAELYIPLVLKIANILNLKLDSLDHVNENTFVKLKDKQQWYFIGDNNELDALQINKSNKKYKFFINKNVGDKVVFEDKYSAEKKKYVIETIFPIEKYILWQIVHNFQKLSEEGDLESVQRIEVPEKKDTIDSKYLLQYFKDLHKRTEPLFKKYCENNIPLAMLAVSEGGFLNAVNRIQQEKKGFINFSTGTLEEFKKQKEIALEVIEKELPFYIDGTSALFLSEVRLFPKIHTNLSNLKVPQSVINFLITITEKFGYIAGQIGYMGYAQGNIIFSSIEKEKREFIKSNIISSIRLFESNPGNIGIVSSANKMDCFSEKRIPNELSDACILAQRENLPVLTEDFLYLKMNELQTQKKAPDYFSSLVLLRVLYEKKLVDFNEYLNYFSYLSSYRFKFLPLSINDIEKTVLGDSNVKVVNTENIRKLNFSLTLSDEYGIPFQTAFKFIVNFLFKILMDDAMTLEILERIFFEIIDSFPTRMNKKDLGQMLLKACFEEVKNNKSIFILSSQKQIVYKKIDILFEEAKIYNSMPKFWTPN